MRATAKWVAVVAWANVVVGALQGWRAGSDGLMLLHAHAPGGALVILEFALYGVLQVIAGLGLLERYPAARRYLLWTSAFRVFYAGPWIRTAAESLSTAPVVSAIGLAEIATAATTLWCLLHEDVQPLFPALPRAPRVATDVFAVLLLFVLPQVTARPISQSASAPPSGPPARTASARPAAQRPRYSPAPIKPGAGPATLVPVYDGLPIGDDFTTEDVQLTLTAIQEKPWVHDGVVRSWQIVKSGEIERPWHVQHGRIRISSVPAGLYEVHLAIARHRGDDPTDAGDLSGGASRFEMRTGHGRFRDVVPVMHAIALRAPETGPDPADRPLTLHTVVGGEGDYDRLPRISSHVTFAWDPIPSAVKYDLTLACHDRPDTIQAIVTSPSWTADLPQCPPPHPWRVHVSALGNDSTFVGNMKSSRAFVVDGTPESRAARGLRPAALTLRPTFEGRGPSRIDDRDVSVQLTAWAPMEPTHPPVRVRHGRIKIPRYVPGHYIMSVTIGPDARSRAGCRPRGGDLFGFAEKDIDGVKTDWQPESRVIRVQRMMRLVEPDDPATCDFTSVHVLSPFELRWEPVPDAVEYSLQVKRRSQALADVEPIVLREPAWQGALDSAGPDDAYFVSIAARSANGTDVAILRQQLVVD